MMNLIHGMIMLIKDKHFKRVQLIVLDVILRDILWTYNTWCKPWYNDVMLINDEHFVFSIATDTFTVLDLTI